MKKKYLIILILLFIISFFLSGCETNNQSNEHDENRGNEDFANSLEINRTNLELNTTNSITNNTSTNNHSKSLDDSLGSMDEKNNTTSDTYTNDNTSRASVETELAQFSTTIIDKHENRQNNIRITCSKLNNLTVDSGQTFSFLQTIGETTAEARI